jgi:hypothetical protein
MMQQTSRETLMTAVIRAVNYALRPAAGHPRVALHSAQRARRIQSLTRPDFLPVVGTKAITRRLAGPKVFRGVFRSAHHSFSRCTRF